MMPKLTKKEEKRFKELKKEFLKWQHLLQVDGYRVYIRVKKLKDGFADIESNEYTRVAPLDISKEDLFNAEMKSTMKHEALHLFFHHLEALARWRYASPDQIDIEVERLVTILEKLL